MYGFYCILYVYEYNLHANKVFLSVCVCMYAAMYAAMYVSVCKHVFM